MASPSTSNHNDRIANKVMQKHCQDIVDQVNVDEVILSMHARGRLTLGELNRLNSNSMTDQEKKRLFYTIALADKGSDTFEDFIAILLDRPGNYKPHDGLVSKLIQSREFHSRSYRHMREQPNEHSQAPKAKKMRANATSAISEMPRSETTSELSSESESDMRSRERSEPSSEPESEKNSETSSESESDMRSEPSSESENSETGSEPRSEMSSDPNSDTRSEASSELESDTRSEERLEPRSETTSESSLEQRSETNSELSSDSGLSDVDN